MIEQIPGIYEIECTGNGMIYIGQSFSIWARWRSHIRNLQKRKSVNSNLLKAVDQYGINSLKFSILSVCDVQNLKNEEQKWLDEVPSELKFNSRKATQSTYGFKRKGPFEYPDGMAVIAFCLRTHEAKEYPTALAAEADGFSSQSISQVLNNREPQHKGFFFFYKTDPQPIPNSDYFRPFIGVNLNTGATVEYLATKDVMYDGFRPGGVKAVLDGKRISNKGYFFYYSDSPKPIPNKWGKGYQKARNFVSINLKSGATLRYKTTRSVSIDGFSSSSVFRCLKGLQDSHRGYLWHYEEN